jgi:hypothetical protein
MQRLPYADGELSAPVQQQVIVLVSGWAMALPAEGRKRIIMTTFDRREEAFENLFAHDEEMRFRALAHRAKLIGAWAAGLLGKTGAASATYVQSVLDGVVADGSDAALLQRLTADLSGTTPTVSDRQIRAEMDRLLAESVRAVRQA